jgi:hypothetical protein
MYYFTASGYNRTFHTAIDKTPFEAWTGRQPCLDQLLTFGSKITARKAKTGTNALDPNSFSGIFLGYTMPPWTILSTGTTRHSVTELPNISHPTNYNMEILLISKAPPPNISLKSSLALQTLNGAPIHY